ncbi:GNAT family N-acetyltransferase [Micromonosporaceae bacterium Da 78-11]
MAQQDTDVFVRLERFYDAVPRPYAQAEEHGDLVLFVRQGAGWPYYARPRIGAATPSAADLTAVRQRQRDLGLPEAFEWVHETTPDLLAVARSAGLAVLLAPLLVLDAAALVPDLPVTGATIRLLDPAADDFGHDLATSRSVANLGFGSPAGATPLSEVAAGALITSVAGPAERDAATVQLGADELLRFRDAAAGGGYVIAVVESPTEGMLATGMIQRAGDVAEIAGVATLPSARNRGYASQLTATLARHALTDGVQTVFLSAGDDDVARLYTKVGFRRVGTACIAEPAPSTI